MTESILERFDSLYVTVEFGKWKTLEDSLKNEQPFTQRTIDPETDLKVIDWEMYRNPKLRRAFLGIDR